MPVDTIVKDPERMSLDEIDDTIHRIRTYERERDCQAGVVLIQRRQFGGLYEIVSGAEADQLMSRPVLNEPRTCEWGIKFYLPSYFEELRKKLNGDGQKGYS